MPNTLLRETIEDLLLCALAWIANFIITYALVWQSYKIPELCFTYHPYCDHDEKLTRQLLQSQRRCKEAQSDVTAYAIENSTGNLQASVLMLTGLISVFLEEVFDHYFTLREALLLNVVFGTAFQIMRTVPLSWGYVKRNTQLWKAQWDRSRRFVGEGFPVVSEQAARQVVRKELRRMAKQNKQKRERERQEKECCARLQADAPPSPTTSTSQHHGHQRRRTRDQRVPDDPLSWAMDRHQRART